MKLAQHIRNMGDKEFAEMVGCSRRVVCNWRLGNRTPRPKWAQRIVAKSGGVISMADIYGGK